MVRSGRERKKRRAIRERDRAWIKTTFEGLYRFSPFFPMSAMVDAQIEAALKLSSGVGLLSPEGPQARADEGSSTQLTAEDFKAAVKTLKEMSI